MRAYIVKRLFLIIPTILGISLITFFIIQALPGQPYYAKLATMQISGQQNPITPEIIEQTKKLYGMDKPIPIQYLRWLKRIVTFDFGYSFKDQRKVIVKIKERLPITITLSLIAIFITYIVSIPVGIYSSTHQGTLSDKIITVFLFILYSIPTFWLATMLMLFFCGDTFLNIFPVSGFISTGAEDYPLFKKLLNIAWHLVLPIVSLTYYSFAQLSRYARAGMLEVIRQDYIRTARAKGLSERVVIFKHAFRNSIIPIVTLLAYLLPQLIAGSLIIEMIFSIPGMGLLTYEAILSRDYPVIMATTTIDALLTLVGILLSDVLYAVVDPRITFD